MFLSRIIARQIGFARFQAENDTIFPHTVWQARQLTGNFVSRMKNDMNPTVCTAAPVLLFAPSFGFPDHSACWIIQHAQSFTSLRHSVCRVIRLDGDSACCGVQLLRDSAYCMTQLPFCKSVRLFFTRSFEIKAAGDVL